MILNLGVTDLPYADPEPARKVPKKPGKRPRKPAERQGSLSTGDVAEILEAHYHVMEHFVELHGEEIAHQIENSMQGALENLLSGAPVPAGHDIFGTAMSEIEDVFKNMLSNEELEKIGYPGLPTQAAIKGVSHRFKRPYAKRAKRPSLIDTGLYQSSFKAWVT